MGGPSSGSGFGFNWGGALNPNSVIGNGQAGQVTYWTGAQNVSGNNGFTFDSANKGIKVNLASDLSSNATAFVDIGGSTTGFPSLRLRSGIAPTTPNPGSIWNDSSRNTLLYYFNGVTESSSNILFVVTSDQTVVNSTNEGSILGGVLGTKNVPSNYFVIGKTFRIKVYGIHSAVANPSIRIRVKMGSTVLLDTGSVSSANSSNASFLVEAIITCRSTGNTGTVSAQGFYQESGAGANIFSMGNIGPITLDTTIAQLIDITAQWGTQSNSNTITGSNAVCEIL